MVTAAPLPLSFQRAAWRFLKSFVLVAFCDSLLDPDDLGTCFTIGGKPVIVVRTELGFWGTVRVMIHELAHLLYGGVPDYRKTFHGRWKVYSGGKNHRLLEPSVYYLEKIIMDDLHRRSAQLPGWQLLESGAGVCVPGLRQRLENESLGMIGAARIRTKVLP